MCMNTNFIFIVSSSHRIISPIVPTPYAERLYTYLLRMIGEMEVNFLNLQ